MRESRERPQYEGYVKIAFYREPDEDGYPASGNETLWAKQNSDGTFEIDNVPWFALDASAGDVVEAEADEIGVLRFRRVVRAGGHSTIRVMVMEGSSGRVIELRSQLESIGCESEVYPLKRSSLIAVDIPPDVSLKRVYELLEAAEAAGELGIEAGAISEQHASEWDAAGDSAR